MIKREKKLSIPTLNRLNEEDENVLVDNQENNKSNKINSSSKKHQQNSDEIDELIIDKKMLIPEVEGGRKYVIRFDNNFLLRGIIKTLDSKGFLPVRD